MNSSEFQKLGTFLTLSHTISTFGQLEEVKAIFARKVIVPLLGREPRKQAITEFMKLRKKVANLVAS